jgi:hypothetical protein
LGRLLKTFLRGAGKGRQKLAKIAGGALGCVPPGREQIGRAIRGPMDTKQIQPTAAEI